MHLKQRSSYCFIFSIVPTTLKTTSYFVVNIFLCKTVFGVGWKKNTDSSKPYLVCKQQEIEVFLLCFVRYKVYGKLRLNYYQGKLSYLHHKSLFSHFTRLINNNNNIITEQLYLMIFTIGQRDGRHRWRFPVNSYKISRVLSIRITFFCDSSTSKRYVTYIKSCLIFHILCETVISTNSIHKLYYYHIISP